MINKYQVYAKKSSSVVVCSLLYFIMLGKLSKFNEKPEESLLY